MRTMRLTAAAVLVGLSLIAAGCGGRSGNSYPTGPSAPAPPPPPPPPGPFPSNPQPDDGVLDPTASFMLFASVVPTTPGKFTLRCDFANGSLRPDASVVYTIMFRVATVSSGDVDLKSQLFNGGLPVQFPDKPLGSPPNVRIQVEKNGTIIVPFTSMLPSSDNPTRGYKIRIN